MTTLACLIIFAPSLVLAAVAAVHMDREALPRRKPRAVGTVDETAVCALSEEDMENLIAELADKATRRA